MFLKIFIKTFGKTFSWLHHKVCFSLKNWQKSVHWNTCCHQKMLKMVEKSLHISCKRFSRYILTKIAKIGKFALYSFIYLQVVPAFNGAVQVKRNIIKPTFISFPVKSWGSKRSKISTFKANPSIPAFDSNNAKKDDRPVLHTTLLRAAS